MRSQSSIRVESPIRVGDVPVSPCAIVGIIDSLTIQSRVNILPGTELAVTYVHSRSNRSTFGICCMLGVQSAIVTCYVVVLARPIPLILLPVKIFAPVDCMGYSQSVALRVS